MPVLSPFRLRLLIGALLGVSLLGALDHTVVSTSLATIAADLDALEHMGWIAVGYTLASTALLPVFGKLGDAIGARSVFLVSVAVFLAASLLCGLAPNIGWLVGARIIQGMSSSGVNLMSQTIIAQVTSPRERPKYMSIIGAAFPIAILIGPVIGGLITDYLGWRWVFWINLPIGAVALALAISVVPKVTISSDAKKFDLPGSVLFTGALVALVLGASWFGDSDRQAHSLIAYAGAAIVFAVFFLVQRKTDAPLLPLALFKDRTLAVMLALAGIIGIGIFSVTVYMPTYIQMAYLTTATVSGLVPIATVFGMLVSNLLSGFLVSRNGKYRAYPIIGTALSAVGLLVMSQLPSGLPLWVPMVVMFVVGLGTGLFMNLIIAVAQDAVPTEEVGVTTAAVNLMRQVGGTVTTAIIGSVVGFGVAARLPLGLDTKTLTPHEVLAQPSSVQMEIAAIYHDVFAMVFVGLAFTFAAGVIAALLVPAGRLEEDEQIDNSEDPDRLTSAEPHL